MLRPFISSRTLHGLDAGLAQSAGRAAARRALAECDLPAEALDNPRLYISQLDELLFLNRIAGMAGTDNLLFALGPYASVRNYGPFGDYVTSAPTFGAALRMTCELMAYHASLDRISLGQTGQGFRFTYHAAVRNAPGYSHYATLALAVVLSIATPYIGNRHRRMVALNFPKPRETAGYEAFFGCDVRFDQPELRLVFDPEAEFARRIVPATGDLTLADVARDAFGSAPQTLVETVRALVRASLADDPGIERVAHQLDMSARTLRRRLEDQGTSFRDLARAVRVDMAQELILFSGLDLTEISQRVGYSHVSHLGRAFRQVTGMTPSTARAAQTGR
ncbi:AraC family transcriptional regulator ligand-binding domain-containing protein [Ruegeria pomeroyi]|nr:AraC family transcriptional regulator ligand-binding domain-containing protein [Ruegeria pomeroyi]